MNKHRPTMEERRLIRAAARISAGTSRFFIEPGERYNLDDPTKPASMNIATVTNHPDWDDTDLAHHTDWRTFCRGFDMADGGRAIVDFYVSSTGAEGELLCNVTAYWHAGRLVKIEDTGEPLWPPTGRDAAERFRNAMAT